MEFESSVLNSNSMINNYIRKYDFDCIMKINNCKNFKIFESRKFVENSNLCVVADLYVNKTEDEYFNL